MITVSILINGQPIYTRSASNISKHNSYSKDSEYKVDDGNIIKHKQKDGAIKLAHKLLDTIKEE